VVGLKQSPTAYTDGMRVRFDAGNDNTGATTVNVAALGVKDIKLEDGSTLAAGDISGLTEATFDLSNDRFNLMETPWLTSDSPRNLATSGFQEFANGTIIQWGLQAITTSTVSYNFPITFPTSALLITHGATSGLTTTIASVVSATQFSATASSGTPTIAFIAIGS